VKRKRRARPRTACPAEATVSGELLQIFGLGVFIFGDSGIGKSESALELVGRGHRLVADDVVRVRRAAGGGLRGRAPELSRDYMEIRGLGIINIREIFGARALCAETAIDLAIRLRKWQRGREFDRLGLRFPKDHAVLGCAVPQLTIPVAPGRNIATLIEVACRVQRLRRRGYQASLEIVRKLDRALRKGSGRGGARRSGGGER
jgi:HPr kinase/phosphorylase